MPVEPVTYDVNHPKPLLIVISGPSGVGKDSVLKSLKERQLSLHFVVTATTRPPRPAEVHGIDYFFVAMEEFQHMISHNELLEYSLVYQDYNGIPKWQIRQAVDSGKDVILRIDVQGAAKVRAICPEAVLIFLTPATEQELIQRLRERKSESEESLRLRLETARQELESLSEFDYVVENTQGGLEQCVNDIISVIRAEHLRVHPREVSLL
jgi:guanylate kinase